MLSFYSAFLHGWYFLKFEFLSNKLFFEIVHEIPEGFFLSHSHQYSKEIQYNKHTKIAQNFFLDQANLSFFLEQKSVFFISIFVFDPVQYFSKISQHVRDESFTPPSPTNHPPKNQPSPGRGLLVTMQWCMGSPSVLTEVVGGCPLGVRW